MKYPIEWVLEYAPVEWDQEEVAERLTMSGSEVEHIRDGVMEVKVTPNRGDTLSMIGLAREVAALADEAVKKPDVTVPEAGPKVTDLTRVDVLDPDLCPRYSARVIQGVTIGPSPEWMVRRLEAAGLRSINNVVDVTNYVMLEYGQPLHAFDYDFLAEHRIVVRRATPGETIRTIDGTDRALGPDMLVIADAKRAVAVAGVMGGTDSEISHLTKTVLLESAAFDALSIRRTSKALGMTTDASYRFERTVDPAGVVEASDRAAALIAELAGGTVAEGVVDAYVGAPAPRTLSLRPERCNLLLGTQFTPEAMVEALGALNFQPEGKDPIRVTVPSYRPDVVREDDLAEEVGRLLGYNLIPAAPPRGENLRGGISDWERFRRKVHTLALECGWQEAVTSTLIDGSLADTFGFVGPLLSNPLSREVNMVRPSLLPGLVDVVRRNLRQGRTNLGFFEIGKIYGTEEDLPHDQYKPWETYCWAAAVLGPSTTPAWTGAASVADFYSLKGALQASTDALGIRGVEFRPHQRPGLHPGRTAQIILGGDRYVGVIGELHPDLSVQWDIPGRLVLFEVDVPALHHAVPKTRFQPLPRYPAVTRDLSFVVDRSVPQARIAETISTAAGPLLRDLSLFDVYRGERLGADKQSMAYRLTLRAEDRTLSDAEANETLDRVRAALAEKVGASFR